MTVDAADADELAVEPDVAERDDAHRFRIRKLGQRAAGDVVGPLLRESAGSPARSTRKLRWSTGQVARALE